LSRIWSLSFCHVLLQSSLKLVLKLVEVVLAGELETELLNRGFVLTGVAAVPNPRLVRRFLSCQSAQLPLLLHHKKVSHDFVCFFLSH